MTSTKAGAPAARPDRRQGLSELLVPVLLLGVGAAVLVDASGLEAGLGRTGPVGPKAIPYAIGAALIVGALWLAVDVLRGGHGEAESGEDIDLAVPADKRTVAMLAGVLIATAALIPIVGWPLAGMGLFWGAAYTLGSRKPVLDPLIAGGVSLATWIVFDPLLGVDLPGGPLMGLF